MMRTLRLGFGLWALCCPVAARLAVSAILSGFAWGGTSELSAQPVRRDYYHGDWLSYVNMRQVTAFAQGFDLLYLATPNGVGRFHTVGLRFFPPLTASSGLDDPKILQIAFDDDYQTLWVETPLGSYSYNEVIDEWRREFEFPLALVRDDVSSVRFPSLFTPFELSYHPPGRATPHGVFVDRNLRRFPITSALRDAVNRSRLFIGTWGYGAGEIDAIVEDVRFYRNGPYQDIVQTLYHDGSLWYMGGRGYEDEPPVISVYDARDSAWAYLEPFYAVAATGDVTAITSMEEMVFFGTRFGLLKLDRKRDRWRKYTPVDGLPHEGITALYRDGDLLWVGTQEGPALLDPRADTGRAAIRMTTGAIGSPWVYEFTRAWGYVWAGTQTGLYRIRQSDGDWTRIATDVGLLRGHVRDMALRPEGLWCATDGGLILMDSTLRAREVFRNQVELPDGNLYALAVDGANLWVSSLSGVWRYIRHKSVWRHYTRDDGLLHEFAYDIVLDGSYVWFGTEGGVTRFYWNNPMRLE